MSSETPASTPGEIEVGITPDAILYQIGLSDPEYNTFETTTDSGDPITKPVPGEMNWDIWITATEFGMMVETWFSEIGDDYYGKGGLIPPERAQMIALVFLKDFDPALLELVDGLVPPGYTADEIQRIGEELALAYDAITIMRNKYGDPTKERLEYVEMMRGELTVEEFCKNNSEHAEAWVYSQVL